MRVLIAGRDELFQRFDPANVRSLALAERIGATAAAHPGGRYFWQPVPPLSYSDGVVTIRPPQRGDAGWSRREPFGAGPHQGRVYEHRAAGLVTRFLRYHTGARQVPVVCLGVDR